MGLGERPGPVVGPRAAFLGGEGVIVECWGLGILGDEAVKGWGARRDWGTEGG